MKRTMLKRDFLRFLKLLAEEKSLKGKARQHVEDSIKICEAHLNELCS